MRGFFLSILFFLFNLLFAQSFFNHLGLGEEKTIFPFSSLSPENPAFPLGLKKAQTYGKLSSLFLFAFEKKEERFLFAVQPEFLKIVIPFLKTYHSGIKLKTFFNQDFDIYSPPLPNYPDYYWHFVSKGGIYALAGHFSKTFYDRVSLGFEPGYLFGGNLESFSLESDKSVLASDTIITNYKGMHWKLGGVLSFKKIVFTLTTELFTKINCLTSIRQAGRILDSTEKSEISLGPSYMIGLCYPLSGSINLLFEYQFRDYKKTKINETLFKSLNNRHFFISGLEFPLYKFNTQVGLKQHFTYLKNQNNKPINELGGFLKLRITLPEFGYLFTGLELSYLTDGKLREYQTRIDLNFLFEEFWKKRERRWGTW